MSNVPLVPVCGGGDLLVSFSPSQVQGGSWGFPGVSGLTLYLSPSCKLSMTRNNSGKLLKKSIREPLCSQKDDLPSGRGGVGKGQSDLLCGIDYHISPTSYIPLVCS